MLLSGPIVIDISVNDTPREIYDCTNLSPLRCTGSGPAPEEVLMALRVLDTDKVSLKSGFDKYLSTDEKGKVQGRSDAIGVREQWEPVFQDVSL